VFKIEESLISKESI